LSLLIWDWLSNEMTEHQLLWGKGLKPLVLVD
jgi:hypothetical protein